MSSNITDERIDNFCAVTGATRDRARFFLEASNGDIEVNIQNFLQQFVSCVDNHVFRMRLVAFMKMVKMT